MVRKGFGVRPLEGSIAVVHYTLRTGGAIGKGGDLIYSTLSAVGANDLPSPFVFEVCLSNFFQGSALHFVVVALQDFGGGARNQA